MTVSDEMLGEHLGSFEVVHASYFERSQTEPVALAEKVAVHVEVAKMLEHDPHQLLACESRRAHQSSFALLVPHREVNLEGRRS